MGTFAWDAVPPRLRRALADRLDLGRGAALTLMADAYPDGPDEEFVRTCWPLLRDQWAAKEHDVLHHLVNSLAEKGLGDPSLIGRTVASRTEYLKSCHNTKGLRTSVLAEFTDSFSLSPVSSRQTTNATRIPSAASPVESAPSWAVAPPPSALEDAATVPSSGPSGERPTATMPGQRSQGTVVAHATPSRSRIAGVGGLVVAALLGLASGLAGVLLFTGLYLLGTGAWAAVRHSSWVGPMTRRKTTGLLASGMALTVVGVLAAGITAQNVSAPPLVTDTSTTAPTNPAAGTSSEAPTTSEPVVSPSVDRPLTATRPVTGQPGSALAAAEVVPVKGRAPQTGYARAQFGADWVDVNGNGCDTRNDILARDLRQVIYRPGSQNCVVLSGVLVDPYSGTTLVFQRGSSTSSAVQIDHVVPLGDAWQKGAQGWTADQRIRFANDPLNLLAVEGQLNLQKGDGDAATWLPPNKGYRCTYVARQVAVKRTYGLWVTAAEHDAMIRVLSTCPTQALPSATKSAPRPAPSPAVTQPPRVTPPTRPPAPEPPAPGSAYYGNCAAAWAAGVAPLHQGDLGYRPGLDRDHDGVACEDEP